MYSYKNVSFLVNITSSFVDFSPILPVDIIAAEEMHFPICIEVNFWGGGLLEMNYPFLFMSNMSII